ncbi:predicted protein [Uncinocarpus reesii 1704]|uniref:Oxidoreductase-like domain-containing protein n=1 Tax=Uncinocarpus reesii (strain UAMH 1704) TaxID=336963 RepID=C4JH47_UNCRE|nr:uncharacterized protein UREG_02620 [Uncinocarpus reesii 1704]EEP77771.1 predicted protein [Uncinocarpus reesii 1704]
MEGLSFAWRGHSFRITLCTYCARRIPSCTSKHTLLRNACSIPPPKRTFQSSTHHSLGQESQAPQAYPLKGYYSDILSQPTHISSPSRPATSISSPPPSEPREPTPAEKMSIVFGTRLAGPGYTSRYNPSTPPDSTWQTINGVAVPPRPMEPDNCCMSGCVHCVWDDYRDDVEEWAMRVREAKQRRPRVEAAAKDKGDMKHKPRREVASASLRDLFEGIPVGIREFMRTEKRLKGEEEASGSVLTRGLAQH